MVSNFPKAILLFLLLISPTYVGSGESIKQIFASNGYSGNDQLMQISYGAEI